jgi:hypothetical protein
LNEQVRRNAGRFPGDFVFQVTADEKAEVIAICDHLSRLRFRATLPHAFTEHGALMVANVLNSLRAVEVSVFVVRAFVRLREAATHHLDLARKLADVEHLLGTHDQAIRDLVIAVRRLMAEPQRPSARPIGFRAQPDKAEPKPS